MASVPQTSDVGSSQRPQRFQQHHLHHARPAASEPSSPIRRNVLPEPIGGSDSTKSAIATTAKRPPLLKSASAHVVPGTLSRQNSHDPWTQRLSPTFSRLAKAAPGDDIVVDKASHVRLQHAIFQRGHSVLSSKSSGDQVSGTTNQTTQDVDKTSTSNTHFETQETAVQATIGIIGATAVGKSTFIEKVLDLGRGQSLNSSTGIFPVDDSVFKVTFVEIFAGSVGVQSTGNITWAQGTEARPFPNFDGVVFLYDAMRPDTLNFVPRLQTALEKLGIPSVLVSSKCDNHIARVEVDPALVEEKARIIAKGNPTARISALALESHRRVMSALLRAVLDDRNVKPRKVTPRARASSSLKTPSLGTLRHSRSKSDISSIALKPSSSHSNMPFQKRDVMLIGQDVRLTPGQPHDFAPSNITLVHSQLPQQPHHLDIEAAISTSGLSVLAVNQSPRSFLHDRDSIDEDLAPNIIGDELETHVVDTATNRNLDQQPAAFDQLVRRLVSSSSSKADVKFSPVFLIFYRLFAAPAQLLSTIISQFDESDPMRQEKYLAAIENWLREYPGDFARSTTHDMLSGFLVKIVQNRRTTALSKYLLTLLNDVKEDDDTTWACSDPKDVQGQLHRPSTAQTFFSTSSAESYEQSGPHTPLDSWNSDRFHKNMTDLSTKSIFNSDSTLTLTAMGPSRNGLDSVRSSQTAFDSPETISKQAAQLEPSPIIAFGKPHWHRFMAQPDDLIACELTRIDHTMFNSIRPRDLFRHVMGFLALKHVNRLIEHFNHVAYWATNLVLLRDKPKHRALILEKLMRVARKLRELNNYNALGALIAGIQCSAVHRLSQTKELVSPMVLKDFMKLEILMSTEKGHFAYRLAWSNTSQERIPFLPLHRRDLIVAETKSKTFVDAEDNKKQVRRCQSRDAIVSGNEVKTTCAARSDDDTNDEIDNGDDLVEVKGVDTGLPLSPESSSSDCDSERVLTPTPSSAKLINWPKFNVLGDTMLTIQSAQAIPYPEFPGNEEIRSLLLEGNIIKDEDELYERSVSLEPNSHSSPADGPAITTAAMRRKFAWLTKYGLSDHRWKQ